jgi:hypothetical protein
MRKALCLLLLCASASLASEPPRPVASRETPPGLEGLVWNKWDTPNFVVISLDKGQGSSIRGEAESTLGSFLERWHLSPSKRECKLVCVPDAVMLKRLFGLSEPRCEVRRSDSGVEAAIWIDVGRKDLLPSLIAESELLSGDCAAFAVRGVPLLESSASTVRERLLASIDAPLAPAVGKSDEVDAKVVEANAALLCLLVRKEFGGVAFGRASSSESPWVALGFSSEGEFASTFARYRANLSADLKSGRTPDGYLGARP